MFPGYTGFHYFILNLYFHFKRSFMKKGYNTYSLCRIRQSPILFRVFRSFMPIVVINKFGFKATVMVNLSICTICSVFFLLYFLTFFCLKKLLFTSFYHHYWLINFTCFVINSSGCSMLYNIDLSVITFHL